MRSILCKHPSLPLTLLCFLGRRVFAWFCLDGLLCLWALASALVLFDFQASLFEGLGKLSDHGVSLLQSDESFF